MSVLEELINISKDMRTKKTVKIAKETLLIIKENKPKKAFNSKPKKEKEEKEEVKPIEDINKAIEVAKETIELLKNNKK